MHSSLKTAYYNTLYRVYDPPLTIKIGQHHPALDRLLEKHHRQTWAYLTACNPGSQLLLPQVNAQRQAQLLADLEKTDFLTFPGTGEGLEASWPPEASLLLLGISFEVASKIGRTYGQLAFLYGEKGGPALLVWLALT